MTYDFDADAVGCYHDWIEYERKHFERTGVKRPAFDDGKTNKQKKTCSPSASSAGAPQSPEYHKREFNGLGEMFKQRNSASRGS